METDYIPEFIALAEYGSSYVAAEKLFVSQSTLLRHVQSIEEEFGIPLFERTRKGFILNKEGEIFLPYARQIAGLKNRCYNTLHYADRNDSTIHLCAEGKIIDLMIDFRSSYPQYYFDYCKVDNPEEALYDGSIDIAFLTNVTPMHADHFQTIHYSREEVLALVYEDHPFAQKESVTMEELRRENLVTLTDEIDVSDHFYGENSLSGLRPCVVASVPTGSDLLRMVREKCGIAVIHGRNATTPPAAGLRVLPLNPPIEYDLNIYFRNDIPLGKPAETFVNFARRWITSHQNVNQSLIES